MLRLPELQRAFFRAITSARADEALVGDVRGDDRLGAHGRLDVYARMYRARLVDVLREDYPRLALLLSEERFMTVADAYITAHPSRHPSLRWFGREFASFLDEMAPPGVPAFAADLARLEWSRLAVFDAPDTGALGMDALRRIPPEEWAGLRLDVIPAIELLALRWPVHRIWDALQPDSKTSAAEWHPEDTWLRVWRQDATIYQASMDAIERTALAHVQRGNDFAALCDGLTAMVTPEEAAPTAASLLVRWVTDGILLEGRPASTPPGP